MKKLHIVLLVLIAVGIGVLLSLTGDLSTYDSIAGARSKPGVFVHVIARLDRSRPIEYDAIKNPNLLTFYAMDSVGGETQVVYHEPKPADLESSDRIVLEGRMNKETGQFDCRQILLKCPSKYKDDKKVMEQQLNANAKD